jgi:TPR repeat protein
VIATNATANGLASGESKLIQFSGDDEMSLSDGLINSRSRGDFKMSRNFYFTWPVQLVCLLLILQLPSQQINAEVDLQENVYEPGNFRVLLPGEAEFTTAASDEGEHGKMLLHQGMLSRPGVQIAVWSAHDPIGIVRKYTIEERRENLYDLMISMVKSALPNAKEEISKTPYTFLGLATEKVTLKLRDGNRWWEKQMATVYIDNINYLVEILLSGDDSSDPALSQAEIDRIFQSFTRLHEPEKQQITQGEDSEHSDWQPLVNEKTFESWIQVGDEGVFHILPNGTIRGLGGKAFLVAPDAYSDFEIRGEMLATLGGAGGILFNVKPEEQPRRRPGSGPSGPDRDGLLRLLEKANGGTHIVPENWAQRKVAPGTGYELVVNPTSSDYYVQSSDTRGGGFYRAGTGTLFQGGENIQSMVVDLINRFGNRRGERRKGGELQQDEQAKFFVKLNQPNRWVSFVIRSNGANVSVSMDGESIYTGKKDGSGELIALENIGDEGALYFRNLMIRSPKSEVQMENAVVSPATSIAAKIDFSGKWISERMWLTIQESPNGAVSGTFGRPRQEPVGQLHGAVHGNQLLLKFRTPGGDGDMQIELQEANQAVIRWRKSDSPQGRWDGKYLVERIPQKRPDDSTSANTTVPDVSEATGKVLLAQALAHFTGTAGNVNYDAARTLFQKAAGTSDPLAQMWLARLLARGDAGVQKNAKEAQDLARKAIDRIEQLANENDGEAMFLLATAFKYGLGIDQDEQAGLPWLRRSAEAGNTNGQINYGIYLLFEKQDAAGAKWLEQAAKRGSASALGALGAGYLYGDGLEEDKPKGLKLVRQAAEKGDPNSQNLLGECYELGWGIEKDGIIAGRWYELADRQGLPQAAYNLAMLYQGGNGIVRDEKKLAQWLQQAADRDVTDAIYSLGLCYFDGIGVEKNNEKAVELLETAADRGITWAAYELGRRYQSGEGLQQNHSLAVKWLTKAAEQNLADSQALLGYQYLFGNGVDVDKAYGMQLIRKAADQGLGIAQSVLGEAYLFGNGVEIDYAKARYWLEKGAASDNEIAVKAAQMTLAKLEQAELGGSSANEVAQHFGSGYNQPNVYQQPEYLKWGARNQQEQSYWNQRNAHQQAEYLRGAAQNHRQEQGR